MSPTLRTYLGLSRTPHGLLDMCTPLLAAFVWLGGLPPSWMIPIGLVTTFAAYTVGYAVNDLVDRLVDERRFRRGWREANGYIDAVMPRHPLASGRLSRNQAILWTAVWGLVAGAGCYLLGRPVFALFIVAILLEVAYCLMWRLTPLRIIVSGIVKTVGPVAAVVAVDPRPSLPLLSLLFAWLFFWEIGGQNIPSDWTDIEEDRDLGAQTIPVLVGTVWSARMALASLALAVLLNLTFLASIGGRGAVFLAGLSLPIGAFLLIEPGIGLVTKRSREAVFRLFNRASYYPAALLVAAILVKVLSDL